jgi:hypothetical protein
LASVIITPENGLTWASDGVVCPATVPVMVGATAGSSSITVIPMPVASAPVRAIVAISVTNVVTKVLGTPSTGVNERARSSVVMSAAVPVSM